MLRHRSISWLRFALLSTALLLAVGSVAWGQAYGHSDGDDHYNRHDEARERGYNNGYHDGRRAGHDDSERGRRFRFKNDDWEDSRGYEHWMGDKHEYKSAYREGYEHGYRESYDRHRDRDDWR